jgi:ATP-binding cassette subfamily B protein
MSDIPQTEKDKKVPVLKNTIWVLSIHLKKVPFLAFARLVGFLNNYGSRLLSSFVIGMMIDWIIKYTANPDDGRHYIINSILAFGGFFVLTGIAGILRNYGENLIGFQINYAIPETMLHEKLQSLSTATLEKPEIQNIITRYRENRYSINNASRSLISLLSISITLLIAIIPLIRLIPVATVLLIISSLPVILTNKSIFRKLWDLDKDITVTSRRGGSMVSMITHPETMKEIKLLNAYDYLRGYFDRYVDTYQGRKKSIYNLWSLLDTLNTVLRGGAILYGIYQIILLTGEGMITVGQIAFYISAITIVSDHIDNFTAYLSDYSGVNLRLTEMRELLEYQEEMQKGDIEMPRLSTAPHIKLNDVTFAYPGSEKSVIEHLSLEIKPGEKVAIVGENGAGKTTLVKLLSGIYPVTSGEILINGEDLRLVKPETWYQNLGVLYQDYNTYDDLTVKENIALGRITDQSTEEKIEDAAKKADAEAFIADFSQKYDQVLSEKYEGGTRPSTGQWQKISIARFFYRDAPLLILDEPTASIDAVAEANIFDRIYSFIQNKTVIIISHRFSTVRNADRIIVFDKGQIVEEGSHRELLAKDGKYAHAFKLQAKGYAD